MYSLPIPDSNGTIQFSSLNPRNLNLGHIVNDLTNNTINKGTHIHHDPDIDSTLHHDDLEWLPAFGQSKAAQRHLEKNDVTIGSIFLFFGWFRKVQYLNGHYSYVPSSPDLHVIFGWLRVSEIFDINSNELPPNPIKNHVHFTTQAHPNVVYYANKRDDAGMFHHFSDVLQLTAPNRTRSVWRLPRWLFPRNNLPMTYHGNPNRWTCNKDESVLLESVPIGQEFVIDCDIYPEAIQWAEDIILCGLTSHSSGRLHGAA